MTLNRRSIAEESNVRSALALCTLGKKPNPGKLAKALKRDEGRRFWVGDAELDAAMWRAFNRSAGKAGGIWPFREEVLATVKPPQHMLRIFDAARKRAGRAADAASHLLFGGTDRSACRHRSVAIGVWRALPIGREWPEVWAVRVCSDREQITTGGRWERFLSVEQRRKWESDLGTLLVFPRRRKPRQK